MQTLQNKDTLSGNSKKNGWIMVDEMKTGQKPAGKDEMKTKTDASKDMPPQKSWNTK